MRSGPTPRGPSRAHAPTAAEQAPDRVGVDLSAIQGLIRGCGGRLWLVAEPPGDMVLQIHLPQSTAGGMGVLRASMPRPRYRAGYGSVSRPTVG